MPGRHSLFWKLVALVVGFCLLLISATREIGGYIDLQTSYLSEPARATLQNYAREAEQAAQKGAPAADAWLAEMTHRERGPILIVDGALQSLGSQAIAPALRGHLRFLRGLDWPMSHRSGDRLPLITVPFESLDGQLVIRLPARFRPWQHLALLNALALYVVPALLALLFCGLLYGMLITPLSRLRRQANALRADDLSALAHPAVLRRRDELGELGRSLQHMTQRLQDSVAQQQQLLRDLSHELRTPLSRLHVAWESELPAAQLRERVERETCAMQQLVESTLELAWLDSERPQLPCESIDLGALWEVLRDDACFESDWAPARIGNELPERCRVLGNLNGLAQALENVLRNAIRHSPADGRIRLGGTREGDCWQLFIEDQGPGVPAEQLTAIFRPFTRLSAERPGGKGFGLGLAIASSMIRLQGGEICAENGQPGLKVKLRLPAA